MRLPSAASLLTVTSVVGDPRGHRCDHNTEQQQQQTEQNTGFLHVRSPDAAEHIIPVIDCRTFIQTHPVYDILRESLKNRYKWILIFFEML